ncbi:MAG TPA: alpha-glucuronidase family glycosyl hydrolase, partial [Candidatus Acidoferrales bacterium]|nr:alpha-glucuronidase family glycosyl hydrolase [Candidatus Acidoferrales bacterium]
MKCSSCPNSEWEALCRSPIVFLLVLVCIAPLRAARADTGEAAWLRYARLQPSIAAQYKSLPKEVLVLGDSPVLISAQNELIRGVDGMLREKLRVVHRRDI